MSFLSSSLSRTLAPRIVQRTSGGPVLKRNLNVKTINGGIQAIQGPTHANELSHLPFSYKSKSNFLAKFAVFSTMGFSIPFAAVLYKRTPQA